jgi:micrococcal nuclease
VLDPMSSPLSQPIRALAGVLVLMVVVAGCGRGDRSSAPDSSLPPGSARVTRVVDGDTIVVDLGGRSEKVRLLGIDTPETKSPTKPVQCFGKEASAHLSELLAPGSAVRLERDATERDIYGRLLAYVYRLSDGLFVNLDLAEGGYADILPIAPNLAHADELRAAVDAAHRQDTGLWGTCGGPGHPAS